MKSALLLAVSVAVMLVLSGCIIDTEDPPADPALAPTDEEAPVGENNTTPPLPGSVAPAVLLTASNVSGVAPMVTVFNLSSDSEYIAHLDWAFDADGDGTADATGYGLPRDVEFAFTEPGNFTATLAVTDPEGLEANATLEVTVEAPPPVEIPEPIVFTGTATAVWPATSAVEEHRFNVTEGLNNMTVTFEVSSGGIDYDFYLYAPGDSEATHEAASGNDPTGLTDPQVEPPIFVETPPAGEWRLEVDPFISIDGEYTVTITFG